MMKLLLRFKLKPLDFSNGVLRSTNCYVASDSNRLMYLDLRFYRVMDEKKKSKQKKKVDSNETESNVAIEPEILYDDPKIDADDHTESKSEEKIKDDDNRFFKEKCSFSDISIPSNRFDSKDRLLIAIHPNSFYYTIGAGIIFLCGVTAYFINKFMKLRKKAKESEERSMWLTIKKYLCLGIGLIGIVIVPFLSFNSNVPIRRLYLMKDGRTLKIKYFFYSQNIDISRFRKIAPGETSNDISFCKEDFEDAVENGFPILVNNTMKVITYSTIIYEKAILKEIGRNKYFKIM